MINSATHHAVVVRMLGNSSCTTMISWQMMLIVVKLYPIQKVGAISTCSCIVAAQRYIRTKRFTFESNYKCHHSTKLHQKISSATSTVDGLRDHASA